MLAIFTKSCPMFGLRKLLKGLCSLHCIITENCSKHFISRTVPVFEANGLFIQIRYSRIADFSGHA